MFDYLIKTKKHIVEHGTSFSVKCMNMNKLDYSYKTQLLSQQPSPEAIITIPLGRKGKAGWKGALKSDLLKIVNDYLLKRTMCYGQSALDAWYKNLDNIFSEDKFNELKELKASLDEKVKKIPNDDNSISLSISKNDSGEIRNIYNAKITAIDIDIKALQDGIKSLEDGLAGDKEKKKIENDPQKKTDLQSKIEVAEKDKKNKEDTINNKNTELKDLRYQLSDLVTFIDLKQNGDSYLNEIVNIIKALVLAQKKDDAGSHVIKTEDILKSMMETKPGGAIKIIMEATFKGWQVVAKDDDEFVLENINLDQVTDKEILGKAKEYCEKREITFKFPGPQGVTFSSGPFFSLFLKRTKYARIKNVDFVEGSTDQLKKNKYIIGFEEESNICYGIVSFWNASLEKICGNKWRNWGLSWGIAYNFQNQLDNAINGLIGICWGVQESPVLIHLGGIFGFVDHLAAGYTVNITGIGENEEIPIKKSLDMGGFFSISFRFSNL